MSLNTLYPFQFTLEVPRNRQGRSKKPLKPVIEHDGRMWVARYEGRPGVFFGNNYQDALHNLQSGGA